MQPTTNLTPLLALDNNPIWQNLEFIATTLPKDEIEDAQAETGTGLSIAVEDEALGRYKRDSGRKDLPGPGGRRDYFENLLRSYILPIVADVRQRLLNDETLAAAPILESNYASIAKQLLRTIRTTQITQQLDPEENKRLIAITEFLHLTAAGMRTYRPRKGITEYVDINTGLSAAKFETTFIGRPTRIAFRSNMTDPDQMKCILEGMLDGLPADKRFINIGADVGVKQATALLTAITQYFNDNPDKPALMLGNGTMKYIKDHYSKNAELKAAVDHLPTPQDENAPEVIRGLKQLTEELKKMEEKSKTDPRAQGDGAGPATPRP